MQRLIEQPTGEGDVFDRGVRVGRVHYHLSVYQHFPDIEGESAPSAVEVEGRIVPRGEFDRQKFREARAELTLCLSDGRMLDFLVVDGSGGVRSTGRALYQP